MPIGAKTVLNEEEPNSHQNTYPKWVYLTSFTAENNTDTGTLSSFKHIHSTLNTQ